MSAACVCRCVRKSVKFSAALNSSRARCSTNAIAKKRNYLQGCMIGSTY